ncbi:hypothetical protein C7999DRAFT_38842 [Corynascus novoguineensis]|uniref:NB-ARC domain-containing protein n=1 Tax=Corynascus novoguineensis TaxID=1126955 RepID=A0AAN7HT71_9PEZI|nr:hypothetical protein C7999DRAFT_38842 [Corynascus novoguineensis]
MSSSVGAKSSDNRTSPPSSGAVPEAPTNSVWQATIEKYYGELAKGGMKTSMIDKDLCAEAISRLQSIVFGLNDFVAFTTWAIGLNGKVTGVLWGSIRLIVKFSQPVLLDVIEILESLQSALPRIRKYEQENRNAWAKFSRDSGEVIANVRKYSRRVDKVSDMIRLSKEIYAAETMAALKDFQGHRVRSDSAKLPCFMIPYGLNLRFFWKGCDNRLRAVGIHGLGGVGKTQLALQYANTSMDVYEIIAWISSETQMKLVQSLSNLANKLGLVEGATEDDYQNIGKVRDWLNTASRPFLLVFDNVDKIDLLDQIWLASSRGSVIITSRSPSQIARRVNTTITLSSFSVEDGREVLQSLTGIRPANDKEEAAAREVCRLIGGLPLAMAQISNFIRDGSYSYAEFLETYEKSAEKIFAKLEPPVEYNHTLLTTWDISLQNLSAKAAALQNLLVFFDPDTIPERLLSNNKVEIQDGRFEFLADDFDFREAVVELNRTSLISRLSGSKALQSKEDRISNFDNAIQMLYHSFPNTWQQRGAHQGHGWASWETCDAALPHVSWLMEMSEKHKLNTSEPGRWADYLWEKKQPLLASTFFEFALGKIDGESIPIAITAQANRIMGYLSIDLARPRAALAAYERALSLRERLEGVSSPGVADVCDSLACAFVEVGNAARAAAHLDRAMAIHEAHDVSAASRTLAILALKRLRAGQADGALAAIRECWRLQGMMQAQIEASRYPKHSGDIMLLARVLWLQGRKAEAQELASRTIEMRRSVYGERGGPRVADSLFTVARMLEDEPVLASRMLREVITMSGDAPELRPHLARALWFSARLEAKMGGQQDNLAELEERAREVRNAIEGREWPDEDSDEGFTRLVSCMLW